MFPKGAWQARKHCFLAMFLKVGQTSKHCFLAMFPKGGQTRKHCFLAMFPQRWANQETLFPIAMFPQNGQTRKYCFLAMFPQGGQTRSIVSYHVSRSTNYYFSVLHNNHFYNLMIVIIVNDCTSGELSKSLESNLSSHYATSGELVTSSSAPRASSVHSLPPDLLVNTLDLKRTLRRWSQDKEQVGTARTDALSKQRNFQCSTETKNNLW